MNLEFEKTEPRRESERVEKSVLRVVHMHLPTSYVPTLSLILREIQIKMKDTVHALGFTCSPAGQQCKLVSRSLVLQRWVCVHSFQDDIYSFGEPTI